MRFTAGSVLPLCCSATGDKRFPSGEQLSADVRLLGQGPLPGDGGLGNGGGTTLCGHTLKWPTLKEFPCSLPGSSALLNCVTYRMELAQVQAPGWKRPEKPVIRPAPRFKISLDAIMNALVSPVCPFEALFQHALQG